MKYPCLGFLVFLLLFLASCSKANNHVGTVKDAATVVESGTVGANRCTDRDGKTYAVGDTFKQDCNTCRCAISPQNEPAIACTLIACQGDAAIETGKDGSTIDVAIDSPGGGREVGTVDAAFDAPEARGEAGNTDAAVDAQARLDVPPTCPAGPPTAGSGPCPAGAVCQYSFALQCEPGCSGGTFLEYDCYNNLWRQIRATAGAPVCYCPPGLDAKADGPG